MSTYTNTLGLAAGLFTTLNTAPTVAATASCACGGVLAGKATTLSVLGADNGGEASLRYTWAATTLPAGATAPTFSLNKSHDAQTTLATFRKAGVYTLTATITDAAGLSTRSSVTLTVQQTFTSVALAPRTGGVVLGTSQLCAATALDQFGRPMTAGTYSFDWSATTLPEGAADPTFSVDNSALAATTTVGFSKAGVYGLAATVTDGNGRALQGTTSLRVNATPTCVDVSSAAGWTVDGNTIALAAAGFDQFGNAIASPARVTWAATTLPLGAPAPTFSANSTALATSTTVTFRKAGVYGFTATIYDASGRSATSAVSVTVNQTFTSVVTTLRAGTVVYGTSQLVSAVALDQFGRAMAGTFRYDWSATTLPEGASAPTFSVNNSAEARATTVGFSQAGVYGLAVAATDGNGVSRQAATSLRVNATPTRVDVTSAAGSTVTGASVALAATGYDQFGNAIAAPARVTWMTTALPYRAPTPTFSVNATANAGNTTVSFRKVGAYSFSATIVDASGRSAQGTVSVTVVSTLTSVVLDATQVQLAAGATRQFTARGVDQFRTLMATQPAWSWSATGGTIGETGLYTAPADGGSFTVTARSGDVSGSATVTVASGFLNLQDTALGNLVQSFFADGSINRNDMISILRSVGSDDNVVDAAEFADLKVILNNAAALNMPGYVQVLAGDVVNGNQANAYYQSQTLGNLAAGSSVGQLTRLVDKWFLGADRPSTSYSYQQAAGTLFVGGPTYTDTKQGYLGDCYLIAALGTIAKSSPAAVQNMFVDNGDGTWTVRFYAGGVADYVTVDRYLPTDSWGNLVYHGVGASASSTSTELWLALAEKAYAQWNETGKEGRDGRNAYASIEGGWMANVDAQVLGRSAANYYFNSSTKQTMIDSLAANKAVTLGTYSSPGNGLYGYHAYMVVGYNGSADTFSVINPWGFAHPGPLNWSQLQSSCSLFTVADTSGSVPISAARATQSAAADFARATVDAIHQLASAASWSPRSARAVDALLADCCVA